MNKKGIDLTKKVVHSSPNYLDIKPDRHHGWYSEIHPIESSAWNYNKRPSDYIIQTSYIAKEDTSESDLSHSYRKVSEPISTNIWNDFSPLYNSNSSKDTKKPKCGKYRVNLILRLRSLWSRRSQSQTHKHDTNNEHINTTTIAQMTKITSSPLTKTTNTNVATTSKMTTSTPIAATSLTNKYSNKTTLSNSSRENQISQIKSVNSYPTHKHDKLSSAYKPKSHMRLHRKTPTTIKSSHSDGCLWYSYYKELVCAHNRYSSGFFNDPKNQTSINTNGLLKETSQSNIHSLSTGNICCLFALRCVPSLECTKLPVTHSCESLRRLSLPSSSIMLGKKSKLSHKFITNSSTSLTDTTIIPINQLKSHPCYQDQKHNLSKWLKETLSNTDLDTTMDNTQNHNNHEKSEYISTTNTPNTTITTGFTTTYTTTTTTNNNNNIDKNHNRNIDINNVNNQNQNHNLNKQINSNKLNYDLVNNYEDENQCMIKNCKLHENDFMENFKHVHFADELNYSSSVTTLNSLSSLCSSLSSLYYSNLHSSISSINSASSSSLLQSHYNLPQLSLSSSTSLPLQLTSTQLQQQQQQLDEEQLIETQTQQSQISNYKMEKNKFNFSIKQTQTKQNTSIKWINKHLKSKKFLGRKKRNKHRGYNTPFVTVNVIKDTSEPPVVPEHVLDRLRPDTRWEAKFSNPITCDDFKSRLCSQKVCLAQLWSPYLHSIHVEVHIIIDGLPLFDPISKEVRLRYTLNHWNTFKETAKLTKISDLTKQLTLYDHRWVEVYEINLNLSETDELDLNNSKNTLFEFAVVYRGSDFELWDNNHQQNYICYQFCVK